MMVETYKNVSVRRPKITDAQKQRVIREVCRAARGVERLMPVIYCGEVIAWMGWSRQFQQPVVIEHKPWMRTWVDRNGLLCGFTNVDGIINAWTQSAQGKQCIWSKTTYLATGTEGWQHLFNIAGFPGVGAWGGASGVGHRHDDTEVGALMHGGNVSPKTKHIVSAHVRSLNGTVDTVNTFVWYDQVFSYDNSVVSSMTLTMNNGTAPARYVAGGDPGLQIMSAQMGPAVGATAFSSIKYTNQAGTGGQTVPAPTMANGFNSGTPSSGIAAQSAFTITNTDSRSILNCALVTADTGVRQIDSVTMSGTPSPTELVTYILGFQLCWMANHVGTEDTHPFDFVKQMPSLVQVRDGACLTLAEWSQNAVQIWNGSLNVAWA